MNELDVFASEALLLYGLAAVIVGVYWVLTSGWDWLKSMSTIERITWGSAILVLAFIVAS